MFLKSCLASSLLLLISIWGYTQTFSISGKIADKKDGSALIGATIVATPIADSMQKTGNTTDANGDFSINGLKAGTYLLKAIYIGYISVTQRVTLSAQSVQVGTIRMSTGSNTLKNVTVEGKQIRAEQLGDTTQFHADAYKTNPDATAEDLVTKMPGITSDNSGVKVNGETVQQVYVDGKPFFGTDPTLALRNLPAEIIDKIQVFDKLSDQSQFTGFDDGNTQKTMNIITKKNKSNGQFGKAYAGYGTDDTYLAGGSLSNFNGNQRISVIALFNNVNQQNFSSQDILGVTGGSGSNFGGFSRGRGSFGGGGGSSVSNFSVGQQPGITATNSAGINYTDTWGKKIKVTGSYFFNQTSNTTNTDLIRNYFTNSDTTDLYHETDQSGNKNINHRFNLRMEYDIDSNNTIIFTPAVSTQETYGTAHQADTQFLSDNILSRAFSNTISNVTGYSYSGNLLFQHKFHKPKRTISLNIATADNEKNQDGTYYSEQIANTDTIFNQHYTLYNNGYTISGNLVYTEPVGEKGQILVNYNPSYNKGYADKESYNQNPASEQYTDLDTLLSNRYHSTYYIQRGGLSYRIGDRKMNLMVGVNAQQATLLGDQVFPYAFTISKTFADILPIGFFNYRFGNGKNLRIMYRTNTVQPTVNQLQNALDISNPLLEKIGNPSLRQDYEQSLIVRYGATRSKSAKNFFLFLYANYINNYIGNATYIPLRDTLFQSYAITRGAQITQPVNLNGYFNSKAFITYALPADLISSNINLNGGISYTHAPGQINTVTDYSNNYAPAAGVVISSNVSENLDFTISYTGNYNIVSNTVQAQSNNNYFSHVASAKVNWIFWKGVVLNTNITHTYYTGFSNAPSESIVQWNAYAAYKFLKQKSLEVRISVFDMLNQNKNISRTVTDLYIENSTTQVLQQYFMFTLTYTLRNFKGQMPSEDDSRHKYFPGIMPGMRGSGGGMPPSPDGH